MCESGRVRFQKILRGDLLEKKKSIPPSSLLSSRAKKIPLAQALAVGCCRGCIRSLYAVELLYSCIATCTCACCIQPGKLLYSCSGAHGRPRKKTRTRALRRRVRRTGACLLGRRATEGVFELCERQTAVSNPFATATGVVLGERRHKRRGSARMARHVAMRQVNRVQLYTAAPSL